MKSRLNMCLRNRKAIKFISSLTRYINACKISIALSSRTFLKSEQALEYNNIFILLNVPLDNKKENLEPANINKQKGAILSGSTPQNKLLNKLSLIFKKITFDKSKFLADIPVLETRYKHPKSQKKNLYYLFND